MSALTGSPPVIDMAASRHRVAQEIDRACREHGFFYVVGHGVDETLLETLEHESRRFFARPEAQKQEIAMAHGGLAWRGYFPVGAELTSGQADQKQGLYFGAELPLDDPRVQAGVPLHGPNLFPSDMPVLRQAVLDTLSAFTRVGHALMEAVALGLGLAPGYFADHYTRDPTILFRIFAYPALSAGGGPSGLWSVGEHTDYGILTLLRQSDPGLEIRIGSEWRPAPLIEGSLVCNIGDMLERMTGGRYRSTPHRVRNQGARERISLAFFFDPAFQAPVRPIPGCEPGGEDGSRRWDGVSVHDFEGTYGDYLLGKVSKVFPELGRSVGLAAPGNTRGSIP